MFNSLKLEDIHKIIDIELDHLYKRVEELGYKIDLTEKAKDYIADKGYDEAYGARPLKRAIQKYLEDPLAEEIIQSTIHEGDTIKVELDEVTKELTFNVVKGKKKKDNSTEEEK
jgi:ATP-dependent Clp protease ATP-binding subunit ClpC